MEIDLVKHICYLFCQPRKQNHTQYHLHIIWNKATHYNHLLLQLLTIFWSWRWYTWKKSGRG